MVHRLRNGTNRMLLRILTTPLFREFARIQPTNGFLSDEPNHLSCFNRNSYTLVFFNRTNTRYIELKDKTNWLQQTRFV